LQRREPDAAETEDDHRLTRLNPRRIGHGTHTGEDCAAEQCSGFERDVVADRDHRRRRHDGLGRECSGAEPGIQLDAIQRGVGYGGRGE
jgi:hypothetical protein